MSRKAVEDTLKLLINELNTLMPETTFAMNRAAKTVTTPYVVFSVDDISDTSPTLLTTIKFACYDDENKTAIRNTVNADKIRSFFNKQQFVFDDISLHTILIIEQKIPAEYLADKQVIELQFNATIYERN